MDLTLSLTTRCRDGTLWRARCTNFRCHIYLKCYTEYQQEAEIYENVPCLGCALFDGPDGIFLRGRPLPSLVEVPFKGSKSKCMDPDLWSSSSLDGSGIGSLLKKSCTLWMLNNISWRSRAYHINIITPL